MKLGTLALLLVLFSLSACDESSSASDSPYGDQRYERHVSVLGVGTGDCYVYSKGNLFSLVFEQHYNYIGAITVLSQIEMDSPTRMHEEVTISGSFSPDVYTGYCNEEKAAYEPLGGTVACSKSNIVSDALIDDVDVTRLDFARSAVVSQLSGSCDDYLELFEKNAEE